MPPADARVVDAQVGLGAAADDEAGFSGCRTPLTSRKTFARPYMVSVALVVTLAWAALRTRNLPVVRSSAASNLMRTGPGNT